MSVEARQYVLPEEPPERSARLGETDAVGLQEILTGVFATSRDAPASRAVPVLPLDERLIRFASRACGFGVLGAAILATAWLILRR